MENPSMTTQLRDFRSKVPKELLKKWEAPSGWKCLFKIAQDWTIILSAHQLFVRHPSALTFFLALALMSWGQRGLSTLSHDSIHRNLFHSKSLNDFTANTYLAPAAMSTATIQRHSHAAHHHHLGTKNDPDHGEGNDTSLRHYRNAYYQHKTITSLFLYDILDPLIFKQNVLGSIYEAPLQLLFWWTCATILTSMLEPANSAFEIQGLRINAFVVLFHIARCTIGHAFYVLREIIDHSGLPSTSVLQFTRSSPWGSFFQKYLQPHDDNYHLLHHLLPKIPMSELQEADGWLRNNVEVYREANHFDSYFLGEEALFSQVLHKDEL